MEIPTLLRQAEHRELSYLTLEGTILDLGGDDRATYRTCIKGTHVYTTVNLDDKAQPDIMHDLEKPLPIQDASYDHVLLINVLEHIYKYRELLCEAERVVAPGGTVVVVVPFLFPLHPSPQDFWRFSGETLRRECGAVGLEVEDLVPLGSGVFAARYTMLDRLLPGFVRLAGYYTLRPVAVLIDALFAKLAQLLKKKYDVSDYALGYLLVARKPAQ
jgi:SAM-dependent methyltransferase